MLEKTPLRKHLNADSMNRQLKKQFEEILDHRAKNVTYSLSDVLMSGYAMFSLKYPSLLQFDKERGDEGEIENIKAIYNIKDVPCDSQMRNILDDIDPNELRPAFTKLFAQLQRGKVLEEMTYFNDYYLLSIDGIEAFNSGKIFSKNCSCRKRRDESVEYYEQFLGAVIVHPEKKRSHTRMS